jgi:hypothetical protein
VFVEPLPGNALTCHNNIKMDLREVECKGGSVWSWLRFVSNGVLVTSGVEPSVLLPEG